MRWWTLLLVLACSNPEVDVENKGSVIVEPEQKDWGRDWRRMDLDQLSASIERKEAPLGAPMASEMGCRASQAK